MDISQISFRNTGKILAKLEAFYVSLPLSWQRFLKFGITGGSALAIDVAIYYVLTRYGHVPYLLSRTISLGVAIFWNFSLNRHWTFRATLGKVQQQFPRFLAVIVMTSLLNLLLMKIGVSYLHLHDLLVIFLVSALITFINFFAHYFWSYAEKAQ